MSRRCWAPHADSACEELIDATPSRKRDLVTAMLVAQVIDPGSKLATARGLRAETATSSLGQVLGVSGCDEDDLYAAMDWALARQEAIENALAARHLVNNELSFIFSTNGRTAPSGFSRAKERLDAEMLRLAREEKPKVEITPWVLHDLRRTMASGMARLA